MRIPLTVDRIRVAHRVWLLVTLAACTGGSDPGLDTDSDDAPDPRTIVVLGSSTAAGFGLDDPSTAWVARYASWLEDQGRGDIVVNLAVSAYTTFQILPDGTTSPDNRPRIDPLHNVTAALAESPDAIIVNLPSNDAASRYTVDETMANLERVVREATASDVQMWIATSQPRDLDEERTTLLTSLRDRTLHTWGDHALDFWTPLAAPDGKPLPAYNSGDGIHPNAEGHRLLFEVMRDADLIGALTRP